MVWGCFSRNWPDLDPTEHLWDELGRRQRARPSRPTSVCGLTNPLLEEPHEHSHEHTPKPCGAFPEELKLLQLQRVDRRHINPYELRLGRHLSSYVSQGR